MFGPGRGRPIGKVAPFVRAHDEEAHRGLAKRAGLPFQMRVKPGQIVARGWAKTARLAMIPRANEEVRLFARLPEPPVIQELRVQEQVVPSADHADGRVHVLHALAVVHWPPIVVVGAMRQDILLRLGGFADRYHVGFPQGEVIVRLIELALPLALAEEVA